MNTSLFAGCCLCLFPLSANFAWGAQGGASSGGGKAVVCRNAVSGAIEKAMILDLYEATQEFGLQLREPEATMEAEMYRFVTEYKKSTEDNPNVVTHSDLDAFTNTVRLFRLEDSKLPSIADVGASAPLPAGCRLEQLAVYRDKTNKLSVDKEIWNSLDLMNRAALVAHEVIYRQQRVDGGESTSQVTRRVVGLLFSTTPPPPRRNLNLNRMPSCSATDNANGRSSRFYISSGQGSSKLYFDLLAGRIAVVPASIMVPIEIKPETLIQGVGVPMVLDAKAEFEDTVPVMSAPYDGFKVFVTYENNEPFNIKIINSENKIISDSTVTNCTSQK